MCFSQVNPLSHLSENETEISQDKMDIQETFAVSQGYVIETEVDSEYELPEDTWLYFEKFVSCRKQTAIVILLLECLSARAQ